MNSPESFPPQVDEMLPFPHADEVSVAEVVCRDLLECAPDVPLHEAARRMSERRVSSILVVEDDAVLGIWTERDALAVDFDDPATFALAVRAAMSAPVRTVSHTTLLHDLAVRFREEHLRHYLVVDEAGRRVGIVSQSDVVLNQGIEHYLKLRKVDSLVKGGLHARPAWERPRAACARAGSMRWRWITVPRRSRPQQGATASSPSATSPAWWRAAPGSARWAKSPPGR